MKFLSRAITAVGLFGTALLGTAPALAQQTTCSVTGTSSPISATYDPFSPQGLPTTDVSVKVTRLNLSGGGDTRVVNMYLTGPASANGSVVEVVSVTPFGKGQVSFEGTGLDIYYDTGESRPALLPYTLSPSTSARFLKIDFTGNNSDSDYAIVNLRVTLPAYLDASAGGQISLDGTYGCFVRGGQGNGTEVSGSFANAISFQVTIPSALQATFAGTALDFGEIGDVTDQDVQSAPGNYVTAPVNYVRVQSTGPYQVSLTSQNNYVLTPGGAATQDPLQRVGYRLRFLGQTRSTSNTQAIAFVCPRAGVGTALEDRLHLQAQLAEGGVGRLPSPVYRDTLTVTISPLAAGTATTSPGECANLSGTF